METSRLYARTVLPVEPEWVEQVGAHLVRRTYAEPHWSGSQGQVVARETVTLLGVVLVAGRDVPYARHDPVLAHEMFVRHALVEGDWRGTHHAFWRGNAERLTDLSSLRDRTRRDDLVVEAEALEAFYESRVPEHVVSTRHFDRWWKTQRRETPDLLDVDPLALLDTAGTGGGFPDTWSVGGRELPLTYRFEPGADDDGVTVDVALPALTWLDLGTFAWQVPGRRRELVATLLRLVPADVRRALAAAHVLADDVLQRLPSTGTDTAPAVPLAEALSAVVADLGVEVAPRAWPLARLPPHLRTRVRVVDPSGRVLDAARDVVGLRARTDAAVRALVARTFGHVEQRGLVSWPEGLRLGTLRADVQGVPVVAEVTLADEADGLALRVVATPAERARSLRGAVRRLVRESVGVPSKQLLDGLAPADRLPLAVAPHGSPAAVLADAHAAAVDALVARAGPALALPVDADGLARLVDAVRPDVVPATRRALDALRAAVVAGRALRVRLEELEGHPSPEVRQARRDLLAQLDGLLHPRAAQDLGLARVVDLPRWLTAADRRVDRLLDDPRRDAAGLRLVRDVEVEADRLSTVAAPGSLERAELDRLRGPLQELRVATFAPDVPTAGRVSDARLLAVLDDVAARLEAT